MTGLARIYQIIFASMLSFALGTAAGAVSSYVTVKDEVAALTARVVVVEQSVAEWRAADADTARTLSAQIHDAVQILTDLRIRLGPMPEPKR